MDQNDRTRGSGAARPDRDLDPSSTDSSSETASAQGPQSELERELADAKTEAASYLDLAQRRQAEFLNYKRRIEQDRADFARSALADVITKVLPAVDDLDLAIASLPAELANTGWAQGIVHIHRKLKSSLDDLKVKPIEAVGKPEDPWQHESVGQEPSESIPAGSVTRVVRTGYTLDGRVIRPAQVLVSSGPPDSPRKS
jgi:molecular chaperone GrpE